MNNEKFKQIQSLLEKSKRILIAFNSDYTGDSLCAALALSEGLKQTGRNTQLASSHRVPAKFAFLSGVADIKQEIVEYGGNLIIDIKGDKDILNELWYEERQDGVRVFLSPKSNKSFDTAKVQTKVGSEKPDLIFTVGLPSLNFLGDIYDGNADLFFEIPKISIDNSPANELYGEVNLVDLTMTSVSEIVGEIFEKVLPLSLNADIATLLFAGVMSRTKSFQDVKTKPHAFFTASRLAEAGARQEEIVRHLFKTRSLSLLKLWGRALANLQTHPDIGLVSSILTKKDLQHGSSDADIEEVFNELIGTFASAKIVALLSEDSSDRIIGFVSGKDMLDMEDLFIELGARVLQPNRAKFEIEDAGHLSEARNGVKNKIENWLKATRQI